MLWHTQVELACAQNAFSFHFPSSSQHKSPTSRLHESSLALASWGIIPNSAHLCSLHLSRALLLLLWAGLTVLVIAPPQMCLSGGFTKTVPTLFLLSLLVSGTQPWLRILTYFLHTQTHGRSSLSPAENKSPLKSSQRGLLLSLTTFLEYTLETPGICTQTQSWGKQRPNKHKDSVKCPGKPKHECSYLLSCLPNREQELLTIFLSKSTGLFSVMLYT